MKLHVNTLEIYYESGSIDFGRPSLFLMPGGLGMNHAIFKPAFDSLRDCINVIYYDPRGTGKSESGPEHSWCLATFASDILELIKLIGTSNNYLYAHSAACAVALEAAQMDNQLVNGLILSNPTILPIESSFEEFKKLRGDLAMSLARRFWQEEDRSVIPDYLTTVYPLYDTTIRPEKQANSIEMNIDQFFATKREVHDVDILGRISQLDIRLKLFLGKHDPLGNLEKIYSKFESKNVFPPTELFEQSGHDHLLSEPDKTINAVKSFICDQ